MNLLPRPLRELWVKACGLARLRERLLEARGAAISKPKDENDVVEDDRDSDKNLAKVSDELAKKEPRRPGQPVPGDFAAAVAVEPVRRPDARVGASVANASRESESRLAERVGRAAGGGAGRPVFALPAFVQAGSQGATCARSASSIAFCKHVEASGFKYRRIDLASFHLSVKCSDLTVLGGLPGTGKSSLPRLYAEALAGEEGQPRAASLSARRRQPLVARHARPARPDQRPRSLLSAGRKRIIPVPDLGPGRGVPGAGSIPGSTSSASTR